MARKKQPEFRGRYWGINPEGRVQSVWEHRDRGTTLSTSGKDGVHLTHHVVHGRDPKSEVRLVFHLTDVEYVPQGSMDTPHEERIVEALKAKAAQKKQ